MHKLGHHGISILLTSPFIPFFIIYDMYVIGTIFIFITVSWSSLPDIDIYLQDYGNISLRSYPIKHWIWIPVMVLTYYIMRFFGSFIDKVPKDYDLNSAVSHRGLTHSLWFAIALSIICSILTAVLFGLLYGIDMYYPTYEVYGTINQYLNINYYYIIVAVGAAAFFSVKFHCVGDIFTPSGIHYTTPRTDYGFTIDQFYAKNEVANRSAFPLGVITATYSVFVGYFYGQIPTLYLIGGYILMFLTIIPIWLIFVKTRIGKWFYFIIDGWQK